MVHPRCVRKYNKEYQRYQIGQTQHFVVFDLSDIFDILCYITVLGFLPFTADASVVPQHGSAHLGLGDIFSRFTPLDPPGSV